MRRTLVMDLPWPPSTNLIWRRVGNRTYLSQEARAYRRGAVPAVQAAMLTNGVRTLTCPVSLAIGLHPPRRNSGDIDNRLKALIDTLQHAGLLLNDSQVEHVEATRLECRPGGLAVATLTWEEAE